MTKQRIPHIMEIFLTPTENFRVDFEKSYKTFHRTRGFKIKYLVKFLDFLNQKGWQLFSKRTNLKWWFAQPLINGI
jgi:hypothetical protein